MTDSVLWTLHGVSLAGTRQPRLRDVTLTLRAGVIAIIGYSGAGKTSLLNLLTGFERPTSSTVSASIPTDGDRLPVYWVPQHEALWPHLTATEHLDAVSPHNGAPDQSALLAAFDLTHRADATPSQLSQGELARLSVARALASEAAVLVMDEPLVHVDPARAGRYWQVIREHCTARQTSLVIATHVPEVVLREAEQAICLRDGAVIYDGPVEELYHRPPSPETASFLGAANWFSPAESEQWLGEQESDDRCYRPERLTVEPVPHGPLVVEESHFAGSLAEIELRNERTASMRRIFHRPAGDTLHPGDRVRLAVNLLLMLCVGLLSGCLPAGDEAPQLDVQDVSTWAIPADGSSIPAPRGMTVGPDHNLYVLDNAGRVLVFNPDGQVVRQWNMPEHSVGNPEGICVLRDGRIAVADTHYHRVVFFDQTGTVLGMQGSLGEESGQFIYPVSITEDDSGHFYVAEYGGHDRIQKFAMDGTWLATFGASGTEPGEFQRPSGVVWHDGRIYVVDAFNNRLQIFSESGELQEISGASANAGGLHYPYAISQAGSGQFNVVEYGAGRVTRLDATGTILGRYGSIGGGAGQFSTPWGIASDGPDRVYVSDTGNRRIVVLQL